MRRSICLVLLALCAVLGLSRFAWLGREQVIDLPPVERLACASYAPFRDAETPFDPSFEVSAQRIAEDLAALKPLTDCVRTYSTFTGLEKVPAEARKLGMKVMLGAWIGRDSVQNRRELDRAVALAQEFPDTVRMVIVGNEVLLRREQPVEALAAMLADVRSRTDVPVTYADVWEFWERAPQLVPLVDVVTIHILPYWEDHPIGIEHAVDHVEAIHDLMVPVFAGKPVMIGETGWPSMGRQRQEAEPSRANQARFLRALALRAAEHGWDYNVVEAFDQPWKRASEGTVGGAWGLLETNRTAKPVLGGAVVELPSWKLWLAGSVLLGLFPIGYAFFGRRDTDPIGRLVLIMGGVAGASALGLYGVHLVQSTRSWIEAGANAVAFLACAWTGLLLLLALARDVPFLRDAMGQARLAQARRLMLAIAAIGVAALVFDARYRDFPTSVMLIPALGFLLLSLRGASLPFAKEDRWLALLIAAGSVVVAVLEGGSNDDVLIWAATMLVFSLPVLLGWRAPAR